MSCFEGADHQHDLDAEAALRANLEGLAKLLK